MKFVSWFKQKRVVDNLAKHYSIDSIKTHIELYKLPSQDRFIYTVTFLSLLFLFLNSLNFKETLQNIGIENVYAVSDPIFLEDDGYLIKSMPINTKGDYSDREDVLAYEVQSGDTVSTLASTFDLKISTILENNPFLGGGELLKVSQKLTILPIDGLLYEVKSGDTFSSIEKKYSTPIAEIKKANDIENLIADAKIILPGARLPRPVYVAQTASASVTKGGGYVDIGTQILSVTATDSGIINPVPSNGRFSRGTKGHGYQAVDISRSDKSWVPNIVAACDGTVKKAFSSGSNGGYGLYIVISCDNGYEVLTAHNSLVYVQVGDRVVQGQVIAKMGSTGRSSGVHSHVEVLKDGVRLNPLNFFSVPGM